MTSTDSITIHCWLPDVQGLALGIGLYGGGFALGIFEIVRSFTLSTNLGIAASLILLGYWCTYCRIKATPWEVNVLGSGLWKKSYSCPLEEVAIEAYWVLPELAARANYHAAALTFASEEDWDTGTPYVEIQWYGEEVLNNFRVKQLAEIQVSLGLMKSRRVALEASGADY
jgi:hypothetical protein